MNKFSFRPYNESFIDQACSVKIVGHWPCDFFVFLLTLTLSQSMKTQKKNLANILAAIAQEKITDSHFWIFLGI